MKRIAKILGLSLILTILILGSLSQAPTSAQNPQPSSKISSLLLIQVETKQRLANDELPAEMASILGLSQNSQQPPKALTGLSTQRIFIYLAEPLGQPQIEELEALGLSLYLDSWIPPTGSHPQGFIIADMPIDKLNELTEKDYVIRLDSTQRLAQPQNDLVAIATNADDAWSLGYDGTGVRIAVLDSGLDINHPDIPTPIASKDYSNYPDYLDDTIANTVTGHGTHVVGSALGRGTQSAGQYQGIAPGADLIFLKIGNDTDSHASTAAIVGALHAAVDIYGADIITMSYGGWDTYHDGTSQEAQAVDYAFSQGAVVFTSAGNKASNDEHYSDTIAATSTTDLIQVNVSGSPYSLLYFNLAWYDGLGTHNQLELHYYDSSFNELTDISTGAQSESPRGTEAMVALALLNGSTYYLKVENKSASSQLFHIYAIPLIGSASFEDADPFFTIGTPADADSAIAVGAYTTRDSWTNYQGNGCNIGETVGSVTSFSSRGPRVDTGAQQKPNILAPGSAIISCRDTDVYTWPNADYDSLIIDNDGLNLNGSGPADYFVMQGTSMASPTAAGAAALLLEADPELKGNPAAVRDRLQQAASQASSPDNIWGYGLVDSYKAIGDEVVRKGDFTGDGHIDIFDFVQFADAYGSELGDPNYNAIGDFNDDGDIDIFDFVDFADVYGT